MKPYTMIEIVSGLYTVSVHPDKREAVRKSLEALPYVNAANTNMPGTDIEVFLSDCADGGDVKEMRRLIDRLTRLPRGGYEDYVIKTFVGKSPNAPTTLRAIFPKKFCAEVKAKIEKIHGLTYVFANTNWLDSEVDAVITNRATQSAIDSIYTQIEDVLRETVCN